MHKRNVDSCKAGDKRGMTSDSRVTLLRRPTPHTDESFRGFMIRVSEENGYVRPLWIYFLCGIQGSKYISESAFLSSDASFIDKIASLIGLARTHLEKIMLKPIEGMPQTFLVLGQAVPGFAIHMTSLKICPDCLAEYGYVRRIWDIGPFTVCPYHKRLLLDSCPVCKKRILPHRARISVCSCGCDWRELPHKQVDDGEIALSQLILKLCGLPEAETKGRTVDKSNPLNSLDLEHLLYVLFFIMRQYHGIVDKEGKKAGVEGLHKEVLKAYEVFCDWPENYFRFLSDLRKQNHQVKYHVGLRKDFGLFHAAIYEKFKGPQFDFMRDGFEEYLSKYWDGGHIGKFRGAANVIPRRKYIPKCVATELLKVSKETTESLIEKGTLKSIRWKMGTRRIILIEKKSTLELKARYDECLSAEEAGKLLGLKETAVFDLVKQGFLTALRGPSVDGFKKWMLPPDTVRRLINKVNGKTMPCNIFVGPTIEFHAAVQKVKTFGVSISGFIDAILKDEIVPCGRCGNKGLAGILFDEEEIRKYGAAKFYERAGRTVSAMEACKILKISSQAFCFLMKKDFINASNTFYGRRKTYRVTQQELEKFRNDYFITGPIAGQLKTHPRYISEALIHNGIKPVSGPRIDGGILYLFRRDEVGSVDISSLLDRDKARKCM